MKKIAVFWALCLAFILHFEGSAAASVAPAAAVEQLKIDFFNVGQGNFSLVRLPSTARDPVNLVVDCGYSNKGISTIVVEAPLGPIGLTSSISRRFFSTTRTAAPIRGDTPIYMVLSHGDIDHYQLPVGALDASGLPVSKFGVLGKGYAVKRALLGGDKTTWVSDTAKEFLRWLTDKLKPTSYDFASSIRTVLGNDPRVYSPFPDGLLDSDVEGPCCISRLRSVF